MTGRREGSDVGDPVTLRKLGSQAGPAFVRRWWPTAVEVMFLGLFGALVFPATLLGKDAVIALEVVRGAQVGFLGVVMHEGEPVKSGIIQPVAAATQTYSVSEPALVIMAFAARLASDPVINYIIRFAVRSGSTAQTDSTVPGKILRPRAYCVPGFRRSRVYSGPSLLLS